MDNYVQTIDYGSVPIRRKHKDGNAVAWIWLSDGTYAEIRLDNRTNQPFAVLFDEDACEL